MKRFLFTLSSVYKKYKHVRVSLTQDEARHLLDLLDLDVEAHQALHEDEENITTLYHNMSTTIDIREKLWKQMI